MISTLNVESSIHRPLHPTMISPSTTSNMILPTKIRTIEQIKILITIIINISNIIYILYIINVYYNWTRWKSWKIDGIINSLVPSSFLRIPVVLLLCRRGPGFQPGIYLWREEWEKSTGFSSPLPIVIRDLLFPEDRRVTESGSFSCSPSRGFPIQAGLLCINFRADATRYHIDVVIEIEYIYIYIREYRSKISQGLIFLFVRIVSFLFWKIVLKRSFMERTFG